MYFLDIFLLIIIMIDDVLTLFILFYFDFNFILIFYLDCLGLVVES